MPARPPVALVVHGHFYQPPRDNPWTDEMAREPSAAPFHDWNARIHAECYRANAYARVYGADDRVREMVNNYQRMSFNFGPTLARWIERHDPRILSRIREGDDDQRRRLGAGGALAQVWGHPIAPLLSPADRRTQILWGLQDFRRHFGRDAEGMWLPETAVDPATLEALIDAGLKFTILAPEQIAAVRAPANVWTTVDRDTVDTGRPYKWISPRDPKRTITLCVFNGPLSRELAFGKSVQDANAFVSDVRSAAEASQVAGRRLVIAASDGELYGHHKKFADLTLGYALAVAAPQHGIDVTNLAAILAAEPATWEARIAEGPNGEGTAWSCGHGLGRWRRHCGCAMRPVEDGGWKQDWRGPLRESLDFLRDKAARFFQEAAGALLVDPARARDQYGTVVDDPVAIRVRFLRDHGRPALLRGGAAASQRALKLLEMQRSALLMYASCGWFFDDVAGLESGLVIRQAAYVLDLWRQLGGRPPTQDFLDRLAKARSNERNLGTGADVFRRALRDRVTPESAVAETAFVQLSGAVASTDDGETPGFKVTIRDRAAKPQRKIKGTADARHVRTGDETRLGFTADYDGESQFSARVGKSRFTLDDLTWTAAQPLRLAALIRLSQSPVSASGCRRALALAATIGPLTPADATRVNDVFLHLLLALARDATGGRGTGAHWVLAAEIAQHVELPAKNAEGRMLEEVVWDGIALHHTKKKALPKPLRALAERLGLSPEESVVPAKTSTRFIGAETGS